MSLLRRYIGAELEEEKREYEKLPLVNSYCQVKERVKRVSLGTVGTWVCSTDIEAAKCVKQCKCM